jgi:hypothetical protein
VKEGLSHSSLAFDTDIDIEICDIKYDFTHLFKDKLTKGEISKEELDFAFNTLNNVAESTKMLIEVHKPGRHTIDEFREAVKARQDASQRNTKNVQ